MYTSKHMCASKESVSASDRNNGTIVATVIGQQPVILDASTSKNSWHIWR